MKHDLNNPTATAADGRQHERVDSEIPRYDLPALYFIGRTSDLLQGSGRHKNDDTGSRGFIVDQR